MVAPGARQVAVQTAPGPPWLLRLDLKLTMSLPLLVEVSWPRPWSRQNLAKPSVDKLIHPPHDHLVLLMVLTVMKSLLRVHCVLAAVRSKASQEKFSSH